VPDSFVEEFGEWYDCEHIPQRMAVEGFIDARRFTHVSGPRRQLCLFDLQTVEVLESAPYLDLGARPTKQTEQVLQLCNVEARGVYRIAAESGAPGGGASAASATWVCPLAPRSDAADDGAELVRKTDLSGVIRTRVLRRDDGGPSLMVADAAMAAVFDQEPFIGCQRDIPSSSSGGEVPSAAVGAFHKIFQASAR
jgi:hypothetical protein